MKFQKIILSIAAAATMFLAPVAQAQYNNSRDLISLHYDNAPDRDDGHAAAAAYTMLKQLGITPHIVNGAVGDGNQSRFVWASNSLFNTIWGNGGWQNARSDWNGSVQRTAYQWRLALNRGGSIWVAEGGQSDFTAAVVRRLKATGGVARSKIIVVQHSAWNEQQANQGDLNYVKSNTVYSRIADGNGNNGTADLNNKSTSFVNKARSSAYSRQWNAAFSYLNPNNKLDFSDTVELLWILRVSKSQVGTVNQWADKYLGSSGGGDTSGGSTGGTACIASGSTLTQAKNNYSGSCSEPRRDCDLVSGRWYCSSQNVDPSNLGTSGGDTDTGGGTSSPSSCQASGSTLSQARNNYAQQCSLPRKDCDNIGGSWVCSSQNL